MGKILLHLYKDFLRLVSQELDKWGVCSASILRALSMPDLSAGVEVTHFS